MTGVTHKALRALLTDPATGIRLNAWAILRGACWLMMAVIGVLALLVFSMGLGA